MNSNTNEKINQVSENTLVTGIDIAKHKHFAYPVDDSGRVLQKSFPILQSRIGFEPTGHYWMNLAVFLTHYGIPLVMVNPMHVNLSKELDDNLQTKNDQKDARWTLQLSSSFRRCGS